MPRAADKAPVRASRRVNEPSDAARLVRGAITRMLEQETFVVLMLTVRNTLIGTPVVVAIGTLTGVEVHPRDVFRAAITNNAAGIVLAHNHPSGDPTPSPEDRELTRRMKAAGELLGIPVMDHVVVTDDSFVSLAEQGEM